MKPKPYKRGYPIAILIGTEQTQAALWKIYSQVAKHKETIPLNGIRNDSKALYNFNESIINSFRPALKEGIKSIIIAAPPKTTFAQELLNHIKTHHTWLIQGQNKATFSTIAGPAITPTQIATLTKTPMFKELLEKTTAEETENLLDILEKRLNSNNNLTRFSLEEAEEVILSNQPSQKLKPEYLLITDNYLANSRSKNRLQRLMQIAANKQIKTRIVNAESNAGIRINQLSGIICLLKTE